MPRGRRRQVTDVDTLQQELDALKQRQAAIRQQIRQMRAGSSNIGKLEEKLGAQLAAAKWTVQEIKQIQPGWDDLGFYGTVAAVAPKPRGRRPRVPEAAE